MIDFVKFEIKGLLPATLEKNTLLDYEQRNLSTDGALIEKKDKNGISKTDKEGNLIYKTPYIQALYRGLEFRIYETNYITVEGSLHKYWNKGAHNFNDFGIDEVNQVIQDLKKKFHLNPVNCILKSLEIGVNINPPAKTKTLLNHCLYHKTDRLKWISTDDEGNYIQALNQRHVLKIYDKKTHYKKRGFEIDKEILRFEIKYLKMIELNAKGISSLQDLLNYGLENFTPLLLKHWQQVVFYDFKALRETKYENTYSNPNYWENLPYELFKYHRNNLNRLMKDNPESIKNKVAKLIQEKADFLNTQTTEINPLSIQLKTVVSTSTNQDPNRRFCKITGFNISMQKDDSILLSHTGLKYYFKTDRKVYNEIKRRFLTSNWSNKDHKTQIKEIAHNIRNTHNNQKLKQERLYHPAQTRLFDLAI